MGVGEILLKTSFQLLVCNITKWKIATLKDLHFSYLNMDQYSVIGLNGLQEGHCSGLCKFWVNSQYLLQIEIAVPVPSAVQPNDGIYMMEISEKNYASYKWSISTLKVFWN